MSTIYNDALSIDRLGGLSRMFDTAARAPASRETVQTSFQPAQTAAH